MIGILKRKFGYGQIIVFGYMFIILFGGLLLSLPISSKTGEWTPYLNSVFTATSATCVTGLVVYDTYTHWSTFGQVIIMALIQVGGLGFMTIIALFSLFLKKNIGLYERKLLMQSAGSIKIGGVVRLVRRVALGTLIVEGTGMLLLAISFVPKMGWSEGLFNALFHSVSAFCNAGFDIMGKYGQFSSITGFQDDVIVNVTIMLLIVIGGIGFIVWNDVITQKWNFKKYQLHSKIALTATMILIFGGAILFFIFENNAAFADLNTGEKIMAAFFQSITPRTAGFNSVEMSELSESGHLLTIILMFIGGSPGSTAGGIKTTTFVVVLLGAIASARHYTHINAFKKRLAESIVKEAS
ncbi:MAG: Trk family potassium uptake protein, partial [Clostridiales bacterium]|nr:Trk family potassium uptake protein [Clostridiales bacterium]